MSDIVETSTYDEIQDRLIVRTAYDNTDVIEANKAAINATPETGKYKGDFVHAARLHMGDIVRLKNLGFNLLSPDTEEVKRTLLHIQQNEPWLLTVNGRPFAKKRAKWV